MLHSRRSSLVEKIISTRVSRGRFNVALLASIMVIVWGFFFWEVYVLGNPNLAYHRSQAPALPYQTLSHAEHPQKALELDLTHLNKFTHTTFLEYTRRVIRTEHFHGERPDITRVNQHLVGPWIQIQQANMSTVMVPQMSQLVLQVPVSPEADTSVFSFGIATTVPRMRESMHGISHWLPHSNAPLHILAPADDGASDMEAHMRQASMNVTIHSDETSFAQRYVSLIKKLYEERGPQTQWLVLADDDTFFPYLATLAYHFTHKYNSSVPMVVGAMSDDLRVIELYGLSVAGGGGIFISVPLAEQLLKERIWETCTRLLNNEGDELLDSCLNKFTPFRPTFDPSLHQMDIYNGDGSSPEAGYIESGRKLLSIHHWKTWYEFDVSLGAAVALATGNEGIFQRWLFDGNTVLTNGYSVVEYPQTGGYGGITTQELAEVEYTWNEGDQEELWRYVHMMGPLRPRKTSEKKRSARLVDAVEVIVPEYV